MEGLIGRFLSFDKMMTGSLIKVVYYILLAILILAGIFNFLAALFSGKVMMALATLVVLPLAIIYVRMLCEMFIVIFRISDNLAAIRKLQEDQSKAP